LQADLQIDQKSGFPPFRGFILEKNLGGKMAQRYTIQAVIYLGNIGSGTQAED
jgi:hypothetical protein